MTRGTASALVAVGLIGGAAAPWWFGGRIQSQFESGIASVPANPLYRVALESYDRGWLTSQAVTAVTILPADEPPFTMRVESHVEHGPIAGGLRQARITTQLPLSPEMTALIGPLFGGDSPFTSVIDISFGGATEATLDSPAATGTIGNGNEVAWQGLRSRVSMNHAATEMDLTAEAPGLALGPAGGPPLVEFTGFAISGTGTKGASGLWSSRGSFDLAQLGFTSSDGSGAFQLKTLHATSSSEEKDGAMDMAASITAAEATAGEGAVTDFALDYSLHDLDAGAMKKVQEWAEAHSNAAPAGLTNEQQGLVLLQQLQPIAGEILARKPSFAIDRLGFVYDGEPFAATARVQYVGAGNFLAFDPMSDLGGSVSFEAPQSTVQRLIETRQLSLLRQQRTQQMLAQGIVAEPTSDELAALEAQAKADSGPMMQDLIAQQLLVPASGNRLRAEAALENGSITVNGRPFPPTSAP